MTTTGYVLCITVPALVFTFLVFTTLFVLWATGRRTPRTPHTSRTPRPAPDPRVLGKTPTDTTCRGHGLDCLLPDLAPLTTPTTPTTPTLTTEPQPDRVLCPRCLTQYSASHDRTRWVPSLFVYKLTRRQRRQAAAWLAQHDRTSAPVPTSTSIPTPTPTSTPTRTR